MSHKTNTLQKGASGILKYEKIRFAMVGVVNTIVDFGILSVLAIFFGLPVFIANIISTSCALMVSYLLNKKAVFGDGDKHNTRQIIKFLVVTLSGLWFLQSIVIVFTWWVLYGIMGVYQSVLFLLVGKAFATVASLVWNYLWYSRFVFRKGRA